MTKSELIAAVAEQAGVSQKDAGAVIDAMFAEVMSQVSSGNEVSIPGIIKFSRAATSARTVRNPQTGETMNKPAGTKTKVQVGSKLKAAGAS